MGKQNVYALLCSATLTGILALPGLASAAWIDLSGDTTGDDPVVTVTHSDDEGLLLSIEFAAVQLEEVVVGLDSYTLVSLPGCGVTPEVGAPLLPVLREHVQLPQGAEISLRILDISAEELSLDQLGIADDLMPAQPPIPKEPGARDAAVFVLDPIAYGLGGYNPVDAARLGDEGQLRGRRFATVEVFPVRHDPVARTVMLLHSIEVAIDFEDADWPTTFELSERFAHPGVDHFADRHFVNADDFDVRARVELPIGYLLITYDSFYEEISEFAAFRRKQGYDVTVVRTSEIPGGSSAQSIQSYVQDAYHSGEIPPAFLLLVGDVHYIPCWWGSHSYSATDVYYATMDGASDLIPDIYIGRLPAASENEASLMATKTLDYARFELGGGSDWIARTTFMASVDNYWISEGTHDYCIASWMEPAGYSCNKRYYHSHNATTNQVIGDINAGLSQLTYSGHGYTSGWSDGPPVDASQLPSLANSGMLPVVQSYACYTGDYSSNTCFGESWLRASNGAVAFWGSSTTSYWDEDDIMQRDAYDAWYGGDYFWFRGSMDEGLWGLHQAYGGGGTSRAYYEQFNLLGDPALDVWTSPPQQLDVDHDSTVPPGTTSISIGVSDPTGSPVKDALVCIYNEGHIHRAAYTDASGLAQLDLDGEEPAGTVVELTVTVHDFVPWTDTFTVEISSGDDDDTALPDDDGPGLHPPTDDDSVVVGQAGCECSADAGRWPHGATAFLTGILLALFAWRRVVHATGST